MSSVGIIDVGSNSVLALAMDSDENVLFSDYQITELARGFKEGMLREERMEYTFQIIYGFHQKLVSVGCRLIHITGTSASREAKNIHRLGNRICDNLGVDYRILSGDEEARYTFLGALSSLKEKEENHLMMDIGGGSTELIFGNSSEIHFKKSYRLGAVRLFNKYSNSEILGSDEIEEIRTEIRNKFSDFKINEKVGNLVGIGGTFTTVASVHKKLDVYNEGVINNTIITYSDLEILFHSMNVGLKRRTSLKGMEAKRAAYILFGSLIYLEFMNFFGLKSVRITDRGLRYGLAFESLKITDKEFDKNTD